MVSQVAAEQKIYDDEEIFVVVECEPEIDEERMLQVLEQIDLADDVTQRVVACTHLFVHVLHRIHASSVLLLRYTHLYPTYITSFGYCNLGEAVTGGVFGELKRPK